MMGENRNKWLWAFIILMLILNGLLLLKCRQILWNSKKNVSEVRGIEKDMFNLKLQNSKMNFSVWIKLIISRW